MWSKYGRMVHLAVALGLAPVPNLGLADELHVITLKHHTAQEVLPFIRPLLNPGDVASGTDYRLIVRTSKKNLVSIEQILAQIDIPPRSLVLTVRHASQRDEAHRSHALSGEARSGDHLHIKIADPAADDQGGLVIEQRGANETLRYQTQARHTATQRQGEQQLRVLEGRRAYIQVGQSVPHVQKILLLTGNQALLAQGVVLHNVTTGFEVLPRVHGDRVTLEITPHLASLNNVATGLVNFQALTTTVAVKRGEWVDLGAIAGAGSEVRHAILESQSNRANERHTILIKVE